MQRVSRSTAVSALPAPPAGGTPGYFTGGDPVAATPATVPGYEWFNNVQEELLSVIEGAGLVASGADRTQLKQAISEMIEVKSGNYALDTGVANAYVVALNPAVAAYTNGLAIRVKFAHTNTGASTLDAGAGPAPMLNDEGAALAAGDAPAGGVASMVYDSVAGAWLLTGLVPSQALSQAAADARYAGIANGVQPGTILPFAGATPPAGYLAVPTAATNISRTTYAALFAAIGTTWGAGDGSTTFGLPYVGADGTLLQSNANLGTTTVGQVISHNHTIVASPLSWATGSTNSILAPTGTYSTSSTGGSQNTAAGSRVNFIIKY